MKTNHNRFLLTCLLASLLLNGALGYKLYQCRTIHYRAHAEPPASWVAPLQRPLKVIETTPKTNPP